MRLVNYWFLAGALALLSFGAQANKISQDDPREMIQQVTEIVIKELQERAEELSNDPKKVREFADEHLLPYVDTLRMGRHIAGRHWRTATPEQQQDFIEQFTLTIMRSYSSGLQKLKITKADTGRSIPDGNDRVVIFQRIQMEGNRASEISYRVFKEKQTGNWMVYDLVLEGVSILLSFRQSYASEIDKKGLSAVIAEMKEKNKVFE